VCVLGICDYSLIMIIFDLPSVVIISFSTIIIFFALQGLRG